MIPMLDLEKLRKALGENILGVNVVASCTITLMNGSDEAIDSEIVRPSFDVIYDTDLNEHHLLALAMFVVL